MANALFRVDRLFCLLVHVGVLSVPAVGVRPWSRGHLPDEDPGSWEDTMCAVFLGDLCVSVCVCAQEALNTRSWSRARAFKAAREAGDPGPATAETA